MTSIWNKYQVGREHIYTHGNGTRDYGGMSTNANGSPHEYMILCCWVNSRVRQWLIEDDWEVSIHYLPSPTQVETELRLANIDACFDANRSSSLDLKEICTKGGGIFTDVA